MAKVEFLNSKRDALAPEQNTIQDSGPSIKEPASPSSAHQVISILGPVEMSPAESVDSKTAVPPSDPPGEKKVEVRRPLITEPAAVNPDHIVKPPMPPSVRTKRSLMLDPRPDEYHTGPGVRTSVPAPFRSNTFPGDIRPAHMRNVGPIPRTPLPPWLKG